MAFPPNNEGENDVPKDNRDPLQEILELESRIRDQEDAQALDLASLRKELEEVKDQIKELIELITAIRGLVKTIGYAEKFAAFVGKWSMIVGGIYAAYKFGLVELADKVKAVGGK